MKSLGQFPSASSLLRQGSGGQAGKAFGGCYVSELLIPVLAEVEAAFLQYKDDLDFQMELSTLLREFAGRPTPITEMKHLSKEFGCRVVLKREDLLHGGAHKTNNVLGQALLAKRMGKKELIAETGAGQHGVAVSMVGALFGIPTKIFMGAKDIERQHSNVQRMRLFGAEVISVDSGSKTLKDAINDALRYWTARSKETYYLFGTVAGPHPFPSLVAHFQRVIGDEARVQCLEKFGRLPHTVCACVGGGSNAIGIFKAFFNDVDVQLIGVEAGGEGIETGKHGAALGMGRPGSLHGSYSYCLQDEDGQILEAHSISAGLDYPGVGPEHSFLKNTKRARYVSVTDHEAVAAFLLLTRKEGIIPALESSHAIAAAEKIASLLRKEDVLLINLSGRGEKDIEQVLRYLEQTEKIPRISFDTPRSVMLSSEAPQCRAYRSATSGATQDDIVRNNAVNPYSLALERKGKPLFVPFVVLGDPDRKRSVEIIRALVESGADALELGFPFSDPSADGSVVQAADVRALQAGIRIDDCFEMLREIRTFTSMPIGLLVYYNLVLQRGVENFYRDCAESGVDSVLIADLPLEHASEVVPIAKAHGIAQVFLVSEVTTDDRLKKIAEIAEGYLYVVSYLGVTGVTDPIMEEKVRQTIQRAEVPDIVKVATLCREFFVATGHPLTEV
ncbi:tryptophan synthase subunit beta [Candidatus Peregrinibacteria bacterium]|nr:tryptophan synthase subunit beta [Candidatus Peregrinibacteria bacterium]